MDEKKEKKIIEKVLLASVNEYKRARRWRIFFTLLFFAYVVFITVSIKIPGAGPSLQSKSTSPHIAVIDIQTALMSSSTTQAILAELKNACENDKAKVVMLRINSPGGTTFQSRVIYKDILYWRNELAGKKKIYAVIEDLGASGAYLVSSATDKIYAGETSLIGSIGTAFSTFGAVDLIHKVGVERRLITSGRLKAMYDPFEPVQAEAKEILESMAEQAHQIFIDDVINGRKDKLKDRHNPELYTGRVWTGRNAKALGLIDDFGYIDSIARSEFDNMPVVVYKKKTSFIDEIKGMNIKLANLWNNLSNSMNLLSTI